MMKLLLKESIIHAVETVLRVLKRGGEQVNGQSRCWVFCSEKDSKLKMVLYLYDPTRSAKVVEEVLGGYSGYLQTDGYAAYNAAVNATRLGCWSHARRKWVECLSKGIEDKNSKAAQALAEFRLRGNCVIFVLQTVVCDFLAKTTKITNWWNRFSPRTSALKVCPKMRFMHSALNA